MSGRFSALSLPNYCTNYFDSLYNPNLCIIDTVTQNIFLNPLIIPNIFTPNNDGINDVFSIKLRGYENIAWKIYNRWGSELKTGELNIKNNGIVELWDGRTNAGIKVPDGTYYYIISLTKKGGKPETKKGFITLLTQLKLQTLKPKIMKNLIKKFIIGCLISMPMISNAQWNNALLPDIRTQNTTRSVGVGTFTNFNRPLANLHINQLLMPNSPFFAVGSLFRTDGSNAVVNQWQLFTGPNVNSTTQKFRLFIPVNSVNATLESSQPGSSIIINTTGIDRMVIDSIGIVSIYNLACNDCLVMANKNGQLYTDNKRLIFLEDKIKLLEQRIAELEILIAKND